MQETRAQSLILEDLTCLRATKPVHHNCWAHALEPGSHNYWAHALQLLKSKSARDCALQQEKPLQWEALAPQLESNSPSPQPEKNCMQQWRPNPARNKYINIFKKDINHFSKAWQLSPWLITPLSAHHWWLLSVLVLFRPSLNIYQEPTVHWAKKRELDHSFPTDSPGIRMVWVCSPRPFVSLLEAALSLLWMSSPPGCREENDDRVHLCTLLGVPARVVRSVGSDPDGVTLGKCIPSKKFSFPLCEKGTWTVLTPSVRPTDAVHAKYLARLRG